LISPGSSSANATSVGVVGAAVGKPVKPALTDPLAEVVEELDGAAGIAARSDPSGFVVKSSAAASESTDHRADDALAILAVILLGFVILRRTGGNARAGVI
jgi:hypothetical protein